MERIFFASGALSGFLAVALGAFGAHGLESRLSQDFLTIFEIGVRYHMYHALALLAAAWACSKWPGRWASSSGWFFLGGILIFSGGLYVLALSGARWLGAITPIGGLAFLAGWLCLSVAALKGNVSTHQL